LLRELPAAVEEVAAMPAGSSMLEIFAKEIEERATEVRVHARQEGVPDAPESTPEDPASDATAYHG
jgi:serine/threonine-protein kinase HipA